MKAILLALALTLFPLPRPFPPTQTPALAPQSRPALVDMHPVLGPEAVRT